MKIQVTQSDIDNGVIRDCKYCPIALALQRAYNNPGLRANQGTFYNDNPYTYLGAFPTKVIQFIEELDMGLKVEPFDFELEFEGLDFIRIKE